MRQGNGRPSPVNTDGIAMFVIILSFWYIRTTLLRLETMPKMKPNSDIKRFARYQAVLTALLAVDSFRKLEIYEILRDEKPSFIGRVIGDLVKDGYLVNASRPKWFWWNVFKPG